jgi:pSer/pThr/pTyr-binding forkhead associated (FHA) protein
LPDNGEWVLCDLGSANGTYVNGRRLAANAEEPLKHGDVLSLGKLKMQILLE